MCLCVVCLCFSSRCVFVCDSLWGNVRPQKVRTHFSNGPTLPTEKHNTQTDMNHGDTTCFFSSFSRDEKVFGVYCRVTVCMCVTDSTVVRWLALCASQQGGPGPFCVTFGCSLWVLGLQRHPFSEVRFIGESKLAKVWMDGC